MGMGGKGGGTISTVAPKVNTLRIQTSNYGQVLPVVIGTNRVPLKLLDYVDFLATSHTEVTHTGGKGIGGGGVDQSNTWYTYSVALAGALCVGTARGIGAIWDSHGRYGLTALSETFVLGATLEYTVAYASTFYDDRGAAYQYTAEYDEYPYSDDRRLPAYSGVPTIKSSYQWHPLVYTSSPTPGSNEYTVTAGVYKFNSDLEGAMVRVTYSYTPTIADGGPGSPSGILNFTFFDGAIGQSAWAYMTGAHPDRALGYSGTCYVANENLDLGTSGALENYSFEVYGKNIFGGGVMDADPADCVEVILTDPFIATGWPVSKLGDLTDMSNACVAQGLFFSPVLDAQQPAADSIQQICDAANVGPVWSEDKLKFIPYCDHPVVGNGRSYIPDLSPIYDLTDDDFKADEGEPPVRLEREDPATLRNRVQVEFMNRDSGYNTDIASDEDAALIYRFGLKSEDVRRYSFIADPDVAKKVANHRRLRITQVDPLTAHFRLGVEYELLEPMDLVTLTERSLGWVRKPVRIKEIEEDPETGDYDITAEDFPFGSATPTLYPKEVPGGDAFERSKDPGNCNTPVIFEAPDKLTNGAYELWLGISGSGADWGGATCRVSADGTTYKRGGAVTSKSRTGLLQATLASATGHDVTNTLDVDLAESAGQLLSGTDEDRDNFRTLCYVESASGFELISYKTATLVSGYRYQLTDLQRGVYGTPVSSHASGAKFLRLDDAPLRLTFAAEDVGKTFYLKLTAFNNFGNREQSEADVTSYTHYLTGGFGNFGQVIGSDVVIDSVPNGGVTAANVRAYRSGGSPGDPITLFKQDGTSRVVPAGTVNDYPFSTYGVLLLNPAGNSYRIVGTDNLAEQAIYYGEIRLGTFTSCNSGGGGGTGGGGTGGATGGRPSAYTNSGYNNPAFCYDGDQSTVSDVTLNDATSSANCTWHTFGAQTATTSIILKVLSSGTKAGGVVNFKVEYTLNGGGSWSTLYSRTGSFGLRTDSVTLSATQDMTQVKVKASGSFAGSDPDQMQHVVAEIWSEAN